MNGCNRGTDYFGKGLVLWGFGGFLGFTKVLMFLELFLDGVGGVVN